VLLNQDTSFSLKNIFYPPTMPLDIRGACSFWADLKSVTDAHGKGSTVATFTRATIATYIDKDTGLVTDAASGEARFEANGYLSEGARTNRKTNSQAIASWSGGGNLIGVPDGTADVVTAPDGSVNGDQLDIDACTGSEATFKYDTTGVATAASYTFSLWMKGAVGGETVYLFYQRMDGAAYAGAALKTLTTSWARYSITGTLDANAAGWTPCIGRDGRDGTQGTATSTMTIYCWGGQDELGAFASSDIPTTTAAVTRNGDSNTYVASGNISNPGTVFVVADFTVNSNQVLAFDTRNTSNVTGVAILQDSNAKPRSLVSNTTTQADMSISTDNFAAGVPKSLALAWDSSDFQFISSGGLGNGTDTSGTVPATHTRIGVGISGANAAQSFGHVRSVAIFASRLSAFDMARLR